MLGHVPTPITASRALGNSLSGDLFLTGSVLVEVDLTVDRNDRVSGWPTVGVSNAASEGTNLPPEAQLSAAFNGIEEVLVERFRERGFAGERAVFTNAPLEVFAPVEGDSQLVTFERDDQTLRVGGVVDLSDLEGAENIAASLENISICISVSGTITVTNGQVDEKDNSITWYPQFGEKLELFAAVDAPVGGPPPLSIAVALAATIMLGAGALFYVRTSRKSDQTTPSTPND